LGRWGSLRGLWRSGRASGGGDAWGLRERCGGGAWVLVGRGVVGVGSVKGHRPMAVEQRVIEGYSGYLPLLASSQHLRPQECHQSVDR